MFKHLSILIYFFFFLLFAVYPAYAESRQILVNSQISNTLSSGVNPKDAEIALEMLLDRMSKDSKEYKVTNIVFPDKETAIREIQKGRVDILSIMSLNYLDIRDEINMKPSAVPSTGDEPLDVYLLLVKKEGNIKSLEQLKNKKIIVRKGHIGTIAIMWLDTLLLDRSLPESNGFFKIIKQVDNGSRALLPVFFGQADACIVHRYAYETIAQLNPQLSKQLKILHESPALLASISCLHNNMDEKTKEFILGFAENLSEDSEGQQYLTIFRMKKTFRYKPEYLHNIEKLYETHKRLKANLKK